MVQDVPADNNGGNDKKPKDEEKSEQFKLLEEIAAKIVEEDDFQDLRMDRENEFSGDVTLADDSKIEFELSLEKSNDIDGTIGVFTIEKNIVSDDKGVEIAHLVLKQEMGKLDLIVEKLP